MKNLVFNLRTAKAQAEGCAKVAKANQMAKRMAKILTTLTLLLTLGVGQMWATTVTVKFKVTGWANVYAYTWDGDNNGNWPGGEITSSLSNGWYSYNLTSGAKIIFNNGSGTQTNNIEGVTEDVCYIWVDDTNKEKKDVNCDGTIDGSDVEYFYRGTSNSWGATKMTQHALGLYSYIGPYSQNNQFKIALSSGGWDYGWDSNVHDLTFNGGVNDGLERADGNYKIKPSGDYYIMVYHPNTSLNSTSSVKINIRSSLYNPSYTITYKDQGNVTYTGSNGASLPTSYTYGTGIASLTDGAKSGYSFGGWFDNPSCTGSAVTSIGTTATGDKTFYAKWTAVVSNTLTVQTDGHGSITTPSGGTTSYTIGTPVSIVAADGDGYTFKNWTVESGTATIASSTSKSTTVTVTAGTSATVQANYTEVKSTVTVNANQTSMGTLKFGSTSKSWGTTASVGVTTTQGITATASSGYIFSRWVLSGGAATSSSLTSGTITLKGDGSGDAGIAKAVFGIEYYYKGGKNGWANPSSDKLTPHESGYYAYYQVNGSYEFKITKNASGYDPQYTTIDNSYGNITLGGGNGSNITDPSGVTHYICVLYPGTAVNDGANPLIFASTTLPDLAPETTYATTFYAGDHGAINAKGTDIAKNGSSSVNIGATARALTATPESGYSFDKWVTTGSVTVTDPYSTSTTVSASAAGGTVTATYLQNSGWYLQGGFDNYDTWETSAKALPVDRPYRGISGVYYRPFSTLDNGDYFGLHDGTNKYSGHESTSSDYNYSSLDQVATLYVNSSKSFQAKTSFSNKWAVINTTGTKTFWIQNPETCHTVTVSNDGTKGTVVLKTDNHGNLATYQYTNGETIRVEIDTMAHYSIASVTIGSTPVTMTHSSGTKYTGTAVMPNSDVTLTVTYTPWYKITLAASPSAGANAPTAAKTTGGASVANNSYVISGTSVTFTKKTANSGYTWSHWEHNSNTNAGTGNTYVATITADANIKAVYTENNYTVTVNAGEGGYVASGSVTGHVSTKVTLPTATAYPGYRFVNWTTTTGSVTYTDQTSANTAQVNGLTAIATVRANFARTYAYIEGRFHVTNANRDGNWTNTFSAGNWDENSTSIPFAYDGSAHEFYLRTFATPKELSDQISSNNPYFYIKISTTSGSLSNTSSYRPYTSGAAYQQLTAAGEENKKQIITPGNTSHSYWFNSTDESGYVKLYFNQSYIWYWLEQTLEYNANGGTGDAPAAKTYYDKGTNATAGTNTFTRTGYHFNGWKTGPSSGTSYAEGASVTMNSNITLYAQWEAETYDISLDQQESAAGWSASGTAAVPTVTYNAVLPAITGTMPTTTGSYGFMGFYTEPLGAGLRLTDGTGAWIADVDGYTDEDKKWIHAGDVTLYAYYRTAQITGITFSTGYVIAPSTSTTVTATIEPMPAVTTSLCWTVLHSNDNPLDPQPTFTPASGSSVTFTTPETSTSYKIVATLRTGSVCGSGDIIDQDTVNFQVAGNHTVTVQYKCGSTTIKASTSMTGRPLNWSDEITPPEIFGYTFSSWTAGDGVTISTDGTNPIVGTTTTTEEIYIKAIYDGQLTANYTQNNYIYFKNTLGWSDVYVNFYTASDWDNSDNGSGSPKGAGNKNVTNRNKHMTQIDDTDVWYYDYGGADITPTLYVSFTDISQENVDEFWAENPGMGVVYPANYPDAISTDKSSETGFKAATPMFVPDENQSAKPINVGGGGKANYYNAGYWTTYTPGTGYTLEIYNSEGNVLLKSLEFTSGDDLMPMKAVVDLEAGQTYKYQLRRGGTESNGVYYGNSGTMTYANCGKDTPWAMTNSPFSMCGITTNTAGDYTFTLSYSTNSGSQYRLRMRVDYPIKNGDFRVIYKDAVHTGWKESAIITQANNAKDIVSFFIRPGSSPEMKIQQADVNASGVITWGSDISVATATLTALSKDSVYNVCLAMDGVGAISLEKIEPYTGNFYIRTDAANSKWDNYRSDPDHLMTYSEYSITHGGYSHYYCHWVTTADSKRKNVKFCIANDYSPCISDTLTRETASGEWANINSFIDENGNLLRSANVRFMWDQHTNTIRRAYLDPAKGDDNFLVLESADSKIANASEVVQTAVVFSDNENWIYEANVKAKANAQIKLVATWGDAPTTIVQYFKGSADETETLITGDNEDTNWYDIRLIYDYKTNRLIAALLPSGNIDDPKPINADVMFIREHQGDISQVTFTDDGALTDIKIAYGVLRFNKWTLNNKEKTGSHSPLAEPKSIYERAMYFISFPFEVNLSEVFGFGTYGQDWIVEYYDGAERARTGWWEGKPGFWRYVWDRKNFVLEPNVGYLLELELGNFKEGSGFWNNDNERLELFFPSSGNLGSITNTTVNCSIPEHACTIDRHATEGLPDTGDPRTSYNRTIFDSHWNVMPVPTYVNATPNAWNNTTWTAKIGPKFLYTWNMDDNTLTATSGAGYRYHAMHAYMVQYGGNVEWITSGTAPSSIVARRTYSEAPTEVEFRLEIQQNEKMVDQTFIALSNDETVSADFQFGEDMSKDFNARNANIFTKIGTTFAAGNTMPMTDQKTIVPVGVVVKKTGDYTFSIPDGTNGIGITLIDEETGIRTSLSALDYTVELAAGDYTERFWLEISPVKGAETGIDPGVDEHDAKIRKVMIDGILYIIRDGKMYDARGARVE